MWRRAALCVIFFIPSFPVSAFLAYQSTLPKRSIALLGKTSWAPWVETAAPAPSKDTKTVVTAQDADIYEAKFAELKAEGQKRIAEREAIQACYKENIRFSTDFACCTFWRADVPSVPKLTKNDPELVPKI